MKEVVVIGAGLAGCEAAYQLSKRGFSVKLYEQKPITRSDAHTLDGYAELVCSNSLKSTDMATASGLLKAELNHLDCLLLRLAKECSVPAGSALAVDRDKFSQLVTKTIQNLPNVTVHSQVVEHFDTSLPTIIATGPLTSGGLAKQIQELTDGFLDFFDAVSPIVEYDSIDMNHAFVQDRYNKHGDKAKHNNSDATNIPDISSTKLYESVSQSDVTCTDIDASDKSDGTDISDENPITQGDYINCPLSKDEYDLFYSELVKAERVQPKEWEGVPYFDSCMPIEVIASRGQDTMRFGPLRPVGFTDPKTGKRPYAVLQLRKENTLGNIYNLVGFQTSLKFGEQKRVFGLIPALKDAEYVRYGVMHRNSFVNAPLVLDKHFAIKKHPNIYIAGQLSGLEGYMESIMSGLIAGISMSNKLNDTPQLDFPLTTIIGTLTDYITRPNSSYSPINANFGILPPITGIRDKRERKLAYSKRAMLDMENITF